MDKQRLYEELTNNPKNIRFKRLCKIAEAFGFSLRKGKGSHFIFTKPDVSELLNFQNIKGKAKPYQVKQLINIIEKYGLSEEDE
jgi:predicted RNA binding protein YcfA (HicA-like mRNA interferase family)